MRFKLKAKKNRRRRPRHNKRRRAKKAAVVAPKRRRRKRRAKAKAPRKNRRRRVRHNKRRRARKNPRRARRNRRTRRNKRSSHPALPTHKGKARRGSKRYKAIRRRVKRGKQLTSGQAAYGAAASRRGGSALRRLSGKVLRRRSGASRGMKAIARTWRAAKGAQRLARGPKEQAYLRAAGLAGVPNPGIGALSGLITLVPTALAGAAGLLGIGALGAFVGGKIQDALTKGAAPSALQAQVPALLTFGLSGIAYAVVRNVKSAAKYAPWIFLGGFLAAVVQAIAHIQLSGPVVGKDPTQPVSDTNPATATSMSLGRKLGLPIGEYTMTGEYTQNGEYTTTGGTDDDESYDTLRGTDDDPDFEDSSDLAGTLSNNVFS